jgi:methyltransferase (TIGR00027 family)
MAQTNVSRSAVNVALTRAHLTWLGVVDDPHAWPMLPPRGRRLATAFRLPGMRQAVHRHPSFPYLAARTLFFDRFVRDAIDGGVRQVVVLAAGYDSRAWRLARPGVTFFEVDRPATQEDKRGRAPDGGPVYVPVDVTDPRLADELLAAGLRPDEPAAFTMEGLTIYLAEDDVANLLIRLADLSAPGSRLAVSFESGFADRRVNRRLMTMYYRRSEPLRFRLRSEAAQSFLAGAGWTTERLLTTPDLDREHLGGTQYAGTMTSGLSYIVTATREHVRLLRRR